MRYQNVDEKILKKVCVNYVNYVTIQCLDRKFSPLMSLYSYHHKPAFGFVFVLFCFFNVGRSGNILNAEFSVQYYTY